MRSILRRCSAMVGGALILSVLLLAVGVPGAALLGVAPIAICLAMHVVMGQGDAHGDQLAATTRRAAHHHPDR
jgi:hypothetical protein